MGTWHEFEVEAEGLAAAARARFDAHGHKVMGTVRADGSPRLSGTEVVFAGDDLWLAGMPGARRFDDLRRDPRVAIHSGSDEPAVWDGDAKLAGTAVEVLADVQPEAHAAVRAVVGESPPGPFELFRVDVTEVVVLSFAPGRQSILVSTWRPGQEIAVVERS